MRLNLHQMREELRKPMDGESMLAFQAECIRKLMTRIEELEIAVAWMRKTRHENAVDEHGELEELKKGDEG